MHVTTSHFSPASRALFTIVFVLQTVAPVHAQSPSFQTPYVTRAEAAMLLLQARVPKIPALVTNGEFPDVPRGTWYERYIVVAERLGIMQANPVTHRIRPEDPVTRAEFISMAGKTFGVTTSVFAPSYLDVPQDAWYSPSAGMAQQLHLFPADPDQSQLRPEEFMIHSEVAKAVQLLIDATSDGGQWSKIAKKLSSPQGYQKISTTTQKVALVKSRGAAPHAAAGTPVIVAYGKAVPPSWDAAQLLKLRQEVLTLINAARAEQHLPALQQHGTLESSAQKYAEDMAQQGFFGHMSPAGETLKDRMERSGYYRPFFQSDCLCIARFVMGENLARGQKTAKEVVTDWLKSPSHREAIMNTDFTDTGIGIKAGVWVEHFGGKQK